MVFAVFNIPKAHCDIQSYRTLQNECGGIYVIWDLYRYDRKNYSYQIDAYLNKSEHSMVNR